MPEIPLGESIPPDTAHAVSVSLPTWESNVGYEEGERWVISRMDTGYPRFFIHKAIDALARDIVERHGSDSQKAILFPTGTAASRCLRFVQDRAPKSVLHNLAVLHLGLDRSMSTSESLKSLAPSISAVVCSPEAFPFAKEYWQHTGDGVSSRRAEFCHRLFKDGHLVLETATQPSSPNRGKPCRGPRRYQRPMSLDESDLPRDVTTRRPDHDSDEPSRFLEERFGRNLDVALFGRAESAIKRRIAGALAAEVDLNIAPLPTVHTELNSRGIVDLTEEDVYLYPCGMNAIFSAHRYLLGARGSLRSINFGFPYVDTLKVLQKFGPGCVFYGHASEQDLDDLEARLIGGEQFLALFCEFPGNPLLTCPNLGRIKELAERYDFAVVVDETIGTFANINVLPFADIVVSSLTKIFSGDCNVMGGSAIINPKSRYYAELKAAAAAGFEDNYWPEDIIFMERNSRDFAPRIDRINANAEAICDVLTASRLVSKVYYPKCNNTAGNFEACRLPSGGYGGLVSVTFHHKQDAVAFYDTLRTAKGPSLGTNFTLTSPYVLLAHYRELDWARGLGVDPDLIRISVGLEETSELVSVFRTALEAAQGAAADQE